jgi:hypothetical protein
LLTLIIGERAAFMVNRWCSRHPLQNCAFRA